MVASTWFSLALILGVAAFIYLLFYNPSAAIRIVQGVVMFLWKFIEALFKGLSAIASAISNFFRR